MKNYLNCGKFCKNQAVKTNQYKLNSCVVLVTVLFSVIFPTGVTFSQTKRTPNGVSEKLIVQGKTREQHREEFIGLNNQGFQLVDQGKYQEALELFERALIICKEISDKASESTIINNIGEVYRFLGQYQIALNSYQQALNIIQQLDYKSGEGITLNLCRLQRLQRLQIKHLTLLSFSTTYQVVT